MLYAFDTVIRLYFASRKPIMLDLACRYLEDRYPDGNNYHIRTGTYRMWETGVKVVEANVVFEIWTNFEGFNWKAFIHHCKVVQSGCQQESLGVTVGGKAWVIGFNAWETWLEELTAIPF